MFNLKKLTIMTTLAMIISSVAFAKEEQTANVEEIVTYGGSVNFKGSIVASSCILDVDSTDKEISLGKYQAQNLKQPRDASSPVPFDLYLLGCDVSTYTNIALKFKGVTIPDSDDMLAPIALEASDTIASGVGIQILKDSKVVKVDGSKETEPFTLIDGDNKLSFQVRYVSLTEDITVGSANATVDFELVYN